MGLQSVKLTATRKTDSGVVSASGYSVLRFEASSDLPCLIVRIASEKKKEKLHIAATLRTKEAFHPTVLAFSDFECRTAIRLMNNHISIIESES